MLSSPEGYRTVLSAYQNWEATFVSSLTVQYFLAQAVSMPSPINYKTLTTIVARKQNKGRAKISAAPPQNWIT
jgi:hypothetical protein